MPRKKLPEKREKMIHVRLTDKLHKRLKMEVASRSLTIQDFVNQLIESHFKKQSGL